MPYHPGVPGVAASVVVDGRTFDEYDPRTHVAQNQVERYIVAESGATFEVHFRFSHPFPNDLAVSVLVTIDGKDLDEPLIRQAEIHDEQGHLSLGPISNNGKNFRQQKYRFAELCIGEGEFSSSAVEAQKQKLKDTGTISLHVFQLETTRPDESLENRERNLHEPGEVHEKALKGEALSHALSLEEAKPTEEIEYFNADYANDGEPIAVFHFYYRSLKALKDLHIVKRTPEPLDLIDCDDDVLQASSPEELRRMFAHWKRREEERQRLKRERSESTTVVGDEEVIGEDCTPAIGSDDADDVEMLRWIDLRKQRRKRRKPTEEDEVIVLD